MVWTLAQRFLRNDSLAEDAVQEIFIQVWKTAGNFDPSRASERTWITTIARRKLIDVQRAQGSRITTEPGGSEIASSPDETTRRAILDEEAVAARRAMSELKPEQQKLLTLALIDGFTHSQIAAETGLPLGTVKTHLRTGLERLRALLRSPDQHFRKEVTT